MFGATVVQQFPAVKAVAEKEFPKTMWLPKDLHRPAEPEPDEDPKQK